ncbi:hypothetical protein TNCV_3183971 [Trichonephila clavipes]|nr:hypothetical protein TNCV_3183971 [Trichonephila clavipes]
MPKQPESALLVKLYYHNSENVKTLQDTNVILRVCLQETISMHDGAPPHNESSAEQNWQTYVRTGDLSENRLVSTITRSHALQLLVMALFER